MQAELHVERLIGKKVRDAGGEVVGRIGEFIVEHLDGDYVLTEVHVGPAAMLERVGGFVTQLPFFAVIRLAQWQYHIAWDQFDWTHPDEPRLKVRKKELERFHSRRAP